MKQYTITGVAIVTTLVFSYFFMKSNWETDQSPSRPWQTDGTSTREVGQKKLEKLTETVHQQLQKYQDQLEQFHTELSHLTDTIAGLEARIESEEELRLQRSDKTTESSKTMQGTSTDSLDHMVENSEPERIFEAELGHWMDDLLNSGYTDDVSTSLAEQQVETSIVNLPSVKLVDMLCNQRFCRASFADDGGGLPDIGGLFGTPPFINEGFSINKLDGTVTVYFTGPSISLKELQIELQQEQMNNN